MKGIRCGDICTLDSLNLAEGSFDAIVGRFVWMYIRDLHSALQGVRKLLKHGGVIVTMEPYYFLDAFTMARRPFIHTIHTWMVQFFLHAKVDLQIGLKMPLHLQNAGFTQCQTSHHIYHASSANSGPLLEWGMQTLCSALPLIAKLGIAPEDQLDPDKIRQKCMEEMRATPEGDAVAAGATVATYAINP